MRRLCALWMCAALGCGSGGDEDGSSETAAGEVDDPAGGIAPCELLSSDDAAAVISDHDGGFVASSGGSLLEGVRSYQCSYSNAGTDLFTVIVTVADDDERFSQIEPSSSAQKEIYPETFREVPVGDRGWISGEPDDMKLTAIQGRSVIQLELMAEGAGEKADRLVELGSAVARRME